jgi:hypothetical protein
VLINQIFGDFSTWRGEIKTIALTIFPTHYGKVLTPPRHMTSKSERTSYIKKRATELIKKASFLRGSDGMVCTLLSTPFLLTCSNFQGKVVNFGHQALRDVLVSFLFGRANRIGNQRPQEFASRIPNKTMALAATVVS